MDIKITKYPSIAIALSIFAFTHVGLNAKDAIVLILEKSTGVTAVKMAQNIGLNSIQNSRSLRAASDSHRLT